MTQQTYQRLLLDRIHNNHRWETETHPNYQIQELDTDEILRTLRMGVEAGRIPDYQGENIPSILDRLGLRRGGLLLNGAIVLFGKKFLPDFAQCQLRLARFKGLDKSEFIDQHQIFGNAFILLEEAMLFLRRHLPVAGKILPGILERKDEPLFPLVALREALVNAICHRTYTSPGGAVSVAIFDDRLEIWNDGTLPFGLTPADLKIDHISHQRNPLISTVFYYRGLIEKWGRGTQKIVSFCVKAGHPEPDFFEQSNSFVVRFLPSGYIAPHRISHNLTDRQRQVLQTLSFSRSEGITFSDIKLKILNPPANRTLRDDFQHLKKLGLIDVQGHGRGAKWVLVQANTNKAE
jgi:ATP-dependent DNA helicase RecG